MENSGEQQKDLLADETDSLFEFTYASQGQRFLNLLIDNIVMRFTISYLTSYGVVYLMSLLFPEIIIQIEERNTLTIFLLLYPVAIFNYAVYYTLMEKLFKGKTIGKFITGTRAIRTDGNELSFRDALLRSLCRLIPFEVFSGFGVPWHDSFTHTMVVKK